MNTRSVWLVAALLGPVCALSTSAWAGEVEQAEHRRLGDEMEKLAQRNAWTGVERNFKELEALQKKGEVLTYDEWYLGAQAARALGDMAACRERLAQAVKVEGTEEAVSWLESIDKTFGPVALKSVDKEAPASLAIAAMPFAPDQRAVVERAQKEIADSRSYDGMLPGGEYTFTSGEVSQTFTVTPGSEVVAVKLTPTQAGGTSAAVAYVGPRLDLGGAFTRGGETLLPGVQPLPPGFGGMGARGAIGVELGLKRGFGVVAQVGYHNLISRSDRPDIEGVPNVGDVMHLGYGLLGGTLRLGDVWLLAGGVGGFGVARVSGVDKLDVVNQQCPYGSEDPSCSWVAGVQEDQREYYPWAGSLSTSGFQASIGYAVFDIGDSLQGGFEVGGGLLFDPQRNYPWGQVAFVVGPAKKSRS